MLLKLERRSFGSDGHSCNTLSNLFCISEIFPTNGKWKVFKNTSPVKRRVRQEYVNVSDQENSKSWRCETPTRMVAYGYLGAARIPA
jgi:hypothetical protein